MLEVPEVRKVARVRRSRLAAINRDLNTARHELEVGVDEYPLAPELLEELCRFFFDHGPLDQAEARLKQLLQAQPDGVSAYQNLGTVCLRQQRYEEAIGWFQQALQKGPTAATTHLYLGDALRGAGKLDDATQAWRDAANLATDLAIKAEVARRLKHTQDTDGNV